MNIDTIQAFLEASTTGSFQQAAKNLMITQSAMSARIKSLEDHLNRRLFFRSRNGAILTAGGKLFLNHATIIQQSWQRGCQEVSLSEKHDFVISLGINMNHWSQLAMRWKQKMIERNPQIEVQFLADYSVPLEQRVCNGSLDIAIIYEPQIRLDTVVENFRQEQLILVSTKARGLEKGLVEGYVFVDRGQEFNRQHIKLFPEAPHHKLVFGSETVAFDHMLAEGGSGYFLLDNVKSYIDEGTLFLIEGAKPISMVSSLVYSANRKNSIPVQQALHCLREIA